MQPTFRSFLSSTLLMFFIGWGGLILVLYYSLPFVWSRWAFFLFGILAVSGTTLPVVYFFHRRFTSEPLVEPHVITRQALWFGVYCATLAWLQLGRLVTVYVILWLAGGLIAAEYFIRIREKAQRKPQTIQDDDSSQPPLS